MGPTPTRTPTFGMRLSCNFVNVYRIAYHIQYTCTRDERASLDLMDILARILTTKIARVRQVGEDPRACSARGERSGIPRYTESRVAQTSFGSNMLL